MEENCILTMSYRDRSLINKFKNVDIFGYKADEFDDWLKRSVKKMLKRTQKRESTKEMQATLGVAEQGPHKSRRRKHVP